MEPKRRRYNQLYCPHCEREVSKSTWYVHHKKFYDEGRKTWRKVPSLTATPDQDFDFGSSDENENVDEGGELHMDVPAASSIDEVFRKHILTLFAHFIRCIHRLRKVLIFMGPRLRAFASS